MTVNLWSWMQPLLRKVVSKITVESFGNWGTCFATASESRDPQRIHWMLEALMEEPIQSKGKYSVPNINKPFLQKKNHFGQFFNLLQGLLLTVQDFMPYRVR